MKRPWRVCSRRSPTICEQPHERAPGGERDRYRPRQDRFCRGAGRRAGRFYWKPIQAGVEERPIAKRCCDCPACRRSACWRKPTDYRRRPRRSRAEIDGIVIDPEALRLPETDRPLVVEGAGGLLVPLTARSPISTSWPDGTRRSCSAPAPRSGPSITACCRSSPARPQPLPLPGRLHRRREQESERIIADLGRCVGSAVCRISIPERPVAAGAFARISGSRISCEGPHDESTSRSGIRSPSTRATRSDLDRQRRGSLAGDRDGRRIFDAISSWWWSPRHRHPHIMQAIKHQADRLDQVIFAGFTTSLRKTLHGA